MNTIEQKLFDIAQATDRPLDEVVTYYLLEAVLRRVSHSAYINELVLRGGMLTRLWVPVGLRVAVDVDFLALYPFDIAATGEKFQNILSAIDFTDGVTFNLDSKQTEGIWMETEFPGARVKIDASLGSYQRKIQIDIGFGDPLVPPAEFISYPTLLGSTLRLQAARPETMVGWKLHGLVEMGAKRWRPKDLYDLMLFSTYLSLSQPELVDAIAIAFSSRNTSLSEVLHMLATPSWWKNSKSGKKRWEWYLRKQPTQVMLKDFHSVVDIVTGGWKSAVEKAACRNPSHIIFDK